MLLVSWVQNQLYTTVEIYILCMSFIMALGNVVKQNSNHTLTESEVLSVSFAELINKG